jgi:hypothetical protein
MPTWMLLKDARDYVYGAYKSRELAGRMIVDGLVARQICWRSPRIEVYGKGLSIDDVATKLWDWSTRVSWDDSMARGGGMRGPRAYAVEVAREDIAKLLPADYRAPESPRVEVPSGRPPEYDIPAITRFVNDWINDNGIADHLSWTIEKVGEALTAARPRVRVPKATRFREIVKPIYDRAKAERDAAKNGIAEKRRPR